MNKYDTGNYNYSVLKIQLPYGILHHHQQTYFVALIPPLHNIVLTITTALYAGSVYHVLH